MKTMLSRLLFAGALLLGLLAPASLLRGDTRAELLADIEATLPTNGGRQITAAGLRSVLTNLAESAAVPATDGTPVVTAGTYADPAWITSLHWSKLASTPTTLAGYGITDAATSAALALKLDASEKGAPGGVAEFDQQALIIDNPSGLARWHRNVAAKVAAGQTISVLCGIDSLTAGSGGYSYIQPFRQMVQEALGDAGIGYQIPSADWEFGLSPVGYAGFSTQTVSTSGVDDSNDGLSIITLTKATTGGSVTFNAGSSASVNRETDTVDVYYLKYPAGATSIRMYAFPSGTVYNGVSGNAAANEIGKQTLIDFGKSASWAGHTVALDQHDGPVRYLGFRFNRICPGGGAQVHFWAKGGSTTQQWAALNASSLQYLAADLSLDLAILCPGMNDRNTRTKAEYKADLEKLIINFRAGNPNVALLLFFPTIPDTSPGALPQFREALLELADTYDCAFVDMAWILGPNGTAVSKGLIQGDRVHPTERGYRMVAKYIFDTIGGASLSQKKNSTYNTWAPRRDVDATSVAGIKLLSGSATWDPPSLEDGATATTTVTVTGARVGNPAYAGLSTLTNQAAQITATISASNTATVTLRNISGGALDIASGTVRVVAARP